MRTYAVWYVLHDELFGWCMKKERVFFLMELVDQLFLQRIIFSFNFKYAGLEYEYNSLIY